MRPRVVSLTRALGASAVVLTLACAPAIRPTVTGSLTSSQLAELWEDPVDLNTRDAFWGPWGPAFAPSAGETYRFLDRKTSGFSPGFTVEDARGVEWSVKQGPEARVEVVVSRILSALGYHQPPVYYLEKWTKDGGPGERVQSAARFRPKSVGLDERGDWSWHRNPFVGTPQYGGLLALMLLLNGTDLKNSNNSLYELDRPVGLSTARRWYVVRDLGAALGETGRLNPRRGDPQAFARIGFIQGVNGDRVRFNYRGRHQELVKNLSTRDLAWMTALVSRLSDRQWRDAFRAGGYDADTSDRFITTIKARLVESRCAAHSPESPAGIACGGGPYVVTPRR